MIERRVWTGTIGGLGAFALAAALSGCSVFGHAAVDCNIVKLQSQSGRSNAEIASALGVAESDVEACHAPGPTDYGMPPEASGGGAPSGEAGGAAPSGGGGGGGGGESSGGAPSGGAPSSP